MGELGLLVTLHGGGEDGECPVNRPKSAWVVEPLAERAGLRELAQPCGLASTLEPEFG
jgi:hypothetical protein